MRSDFSLPPPPTRVWMLLLQYKRRFRYDHDYKLFVCTAVPDCTCILYILLLILIQILQRTVILIEETKITNKQ